MYSTEPATPIFTRPELVPLTPAEVQSAWIEAKAELQAKLRAERLAEAETRYRAPVASEAPTVVKAVVW